MQTPTVSFIRANSYEPDVLRDSLATLLEPFGGMAAFVKPGNRVLLKPNLLTGARPGKECTTRSQLVYDVPATEVPTVAASMRLGVCPNLNAIHYPYLDPKSLRIDDWRLPDKFVPIDFGMPRVIKSTFKHLYVKFIKEPLSAYVRG